MKIGDTFSSKMVVCEEHLAINVGSGDLTVLATPMMLMLMENAAMKAVADKLPEGSTTVGGFIESTHIKPSLLGDEVIATAELTKIDGRKLEFNVYAESRGEIIGKGTHLRFIVDKEKFMQKASGK